MDKQNEELLSDGSEENDSGFWKSLTRLVGLPWDALRFQHHPSETLAKLSLKYHKQTRKKPSSPCDSGDSPAEQWWRSRSRRRTTWSTSSRWLRAICTRDSSGEPRGPRQTKGGGKKDPGKATSHSVFAKHRASSRFIDFFPASSVSPSPLICLFPSQDYDAVGAEEHKNSSQVLVPQELPVTNFQGTRT